jgi:neutral ceramidase
MRSIPLRISCAAGLLCASLAATSAPAAPPSSFRAGAATSNVTPWLGLSMNGNMTDNPASHVHDELHARAIVLDDGQTKLAFVVVDSCMIPREVVTAAKKRIQDRSKIAPDHVLISATHTHSAPTAGPVFQSLPDDQYLRFLAVKIADAVERAVNNLRPAQVGYGMGKNANQLNNRRWKKKPGTIPPDPFGGKSDQVQMNPPPGSPDLIEPAGPIDPEVGVVSLRGTDGKPIAVLSARGTPRRITTAPLPGWSARSSRPNASNLRSWRRWRTARAATSTTSTSAPPAPPGLPTSRSGGSPTNSRRRSSTSRIP